VHRLWKRWIALAVFVVVLGIVFVNLGQWQLRRLEERQQRNDVILANQASPPKPYELVFGRPIAEEDQFQRVRVTGTFDAEQQFQVRYRFNGSQPGYEVVTPLHTTTGATVLVDRGFIPVSHGEAIPDVLPAAPAGAVTVIGHVRRNEHGKSQAIDPVDNRIRLINAPAIGATLPYPVLDGWIAAVEVSPPQQAEFQPLELPEISDGPHFWYAMQWFLFAVIGLSGLFVFVRGDLKDRRTRRTTANVRAPEQFVAPEQCSDTDHLATKE
jgi:cytochrome oxidase assembly protein ShyY1